MKSPRSLLLLLTLMSASVPLSASSLTPVDLRCDGMASPLAASSRPKFAWRADSGERGARQSAWRILVASTPELLKEDRGDLWDSGKRPVARAPGALYAGAPLFPGGRYVWKVLCWDAEDKPSGWSQPGTFEVAPMQPADWQGARWIDDGRPLPQRDEDFYRPDPAPLMRKEFAVRKAVVRARLHMAGIGYAYASLNGSRVNDRELGPPWTHYDKRILFNTYDVSGSVHEGVNCLGFELGNGWFNPLPLRMWGRRNIRDSLPTGRPRVIALLVVDHPDGSTTTLTTGEGWKTSPGPTLRNSIFLGEERDARLEVPGWNTHDFPDGSWKPARVCNAPLEPLQPLLDMPPVRQAGEVAPVAITTPSAGTHIVDFGENFTGIPRLRLRVAEGTRILLRYGELLYADGTLNPMTSVCGQIKGMRTNDRGEETPIGGPGAPAIAWQQDVTIARGGASPDEAGEWYQPDFTFHAFRYMEISGLPTAPMLEDISGIKLHSALADAGSFSCSNDLLNRIQAITRRTFTNNVVSVQSDCPHRERFAYGGDICATSEAFLMNHDMSGFYRKTVRDFGDAARPDGNFTDTAPFVGIQYCGIGWAMAHPLLMEQLYQHYGDSRLIEEQLPAAIKWFDLEASKRENGLVVTGLGDHESMPPIAGPVITTPMFIDTAERMARLCDVIGREADAERYRHTAAESADAWGEEFLEAGTGLVHNGSQSCQALALGFNAAPADARYAVFTRLVESLTRHDDGPQLTTGIFGTRLLLEQLSQSGRHDLAYALATRTTFPSWGWMLENGATTLWETWEQSDNRFSHNHPMFGSISAWFYRHLGGIQIAEDAVGADRLIIHPQPTAGLTWVKSSHQTVRGRVVSNWNRTGQGFAFEITIPPDASATIVLPSGTVTESGKPLAEAEGIQVVESSGIAATTMKATSGQYRFLVTF